MCTLDTIRSLHITLDHFLLTQPFSLTKNGHVLCNQACNINCIPFSRKFIIITLTADNLQRLCKLTAEWN